MKDAVGNDLRVGDLVALQLERPIIYGRITDIQQGGIVTGIKGGQADVRPSIVTVVSNHPIAADPRVPIIGALLCLREDNAPPVEDENLKAKLAADQRTN